MKRTEEIRLFWAEDDYKSLNNFFDWPNLKVQVTPAATFVEAVQLLDRKDLYDVFIIDLILQFSPLPSSMLESRFQEMYGEAKLELAKIDHLKRSLYWGIKLIRYIEDKEEFSAIPIVALSAVANAVTSSMKEELQIRDVIHKRGVQGYELKKSILKVIKHGKSRQ